MDSATIRYAAATRRLGRAAQTGAWWDPGVIVQLAQRLSEAGETAGAEQWFRRVAAEGSGPAMAVLGAIVVDHGDRVEGDRWLRRGAEAGDADSMFQPARFLR